MTAPTLATPKHAWNDAGYRLGLRGGTLDEARELAAQAERDGEAQRRQVWVGYRAAKRKVAGA